MTAVETRVRSVLDAPRGRRFSRTPMVAGRRPAFPESPLARERRLLRQMADNPRVAHRIEHGILPQWMDVARERREREAAAMNTATPPPLPPQPPTAPRRARGRHRAPSRWGRRQALLLGVLSVLGAMIAPVLGSFP
ncbi:hypothetical protein ACFYOC_03805 [Nocardiopsis alba]|uniref:Uncharacterized protein n=1 Tax=Nocardiopsis alba (strain ATCC BAA-2165 / BE74) TaxID=1205910 RepID=J7KZ70_NOCAA|nr:hypothetical protein [Nocardiopsis alba]AFR05821.1 hypothetical protein B005_2038 [Nocardiopsis alba ATCC BAA-2165]